MRPFRVPGYPVVPLVFVVLAGLLLVNTLGTAPVESLFGVAVMALGGGYYAWFSSRARRRAREPQAPGVPDGPT